MEHWLIWPNGALIPTGDLQTGGKGSLLHPQKPVAFSPWSLSGVSDLCLERPILNVGNPMPWASIPDRTKRRGVGESHLHEETAELSVSLWESSVGGFE